MSILVTGGCGFIGSNLVYSLLSQGKKVINLDCMSYNSSSVVSTSENYTFLRRNLHDPGLVDILTEHNVEYVYHLAAQTHVDLSFTNSVDFSRDNVVGTHHLLEALRMYGRSVRLVHVSTDEVYGQVFDHTTENGMLNPTNPYAATKCGAEMLVRAYGHSYGLQYVIVRSNNVYGPRQFPDKLIPIFLKNIFAGKPCEIHGDGKARRHFVFVRDVVSALTTLMDTGTVGEVYNIGTSDEFSVLEVFDILTTATGVNPGTVRVVDRPFNDQRYHIDCSKLMKLGWRPRMSFSDGLAETISWYREHMATFWSGSAKQKDTWLIYGHAGWIGQKYVANATRHVHLVCGEARVNDPEAVSAEIDRTRPTHIACIIGRTHGPGCNTIDWLEQPGRLKDNVRDNLFAPFVLAFECKRRNIKMTYMGTGCIFKYTSEQRIFSEKDKPNFFGSSYSIVKGFSDQMMQLFSDTVLNCRIRMPISADDSPRNFITKITSYEKICSVKNSMTVLEEIIPIIIEMGLRGVTGTFNMTNPGTISHNDILEMYREIVDPQFTWENFSEEEQRAVLASDRSNNELTTSKITERYTELRPICEAVRHTLMNMKKSEY